MQTSMESETATPSPMKMNRHIQWWAWVRTYKSDIGFLLPAILLFVAVVIYPVLSSVGYAFTDWNGIDTHVHFIGFANFTKLLHDATVWTTLRNTILFTSGVALLQNGLGLGFALALDALPAWVRRTSPVLRVIFLLPMLLSPLAVGFAGSYIFNPDFGFLNSFLTQIGHPQWAHDWLGDPHLALGALIIAQIWQWSGFSMIIYLAGLQTIPSELYEAASIDGVTSWQRFRHITWPLLAPATTITTLLTLIGGLKVFDIIVAMTNGGPGYSTESIVMHVVEEGFQFNHFGYAAAISDILLIALFLLTVPVLRALRRREVTA